MVDTDPLVTASPHPQPARRRSLWSRALLVVGIALALLITLVATAVGRPVLILGVDRRPGDVGRSDVLLLASPRVTAGLRLLSIPRDTRVELPGRGTAKINAAYAYGGADLTRQTVSSLLEIPIEGYVVLDFEAVRAVVDALGGITVEVDKRMRYSDPYQDLVIDLEPGRQRLSGEQALGFVRYRSDARGDLARVERQRAFIGALVAELGKPSTWPRLPAAYHALRAHIETNLNDIELLRFGLACALTAQRGVAGETLPGRSATRGGASYWLHDPDATPAAVHQLLGP